jgi:hypothetical protein
MGVPVGLPSLLQAAQDELEILRSYVLPPDEPAIEGAAMTRGDVRGNLLGKGNISIDRHGIRSLSLAQEVSAEGPVHVIFQPIINRANP